MVKDEQLRPSTLRVPGERRVRPAVPAGEQQLDLVPRRERLVAQIFALEGDTAERRADVVDGRDGRVAKNEPAEENALVECRGAAI